MAAAFLFLTMACSLLHLSSGVKVNVALNKPASMSSFYEFGILQAGGAVDGINTAIWPNVIHTANHQPFAWWKVDLLRNVHSATVKIYFRTDNKARRNGVRLYTSTGPLSGQGRSDQLCHTVTGRANGTDISSIYSVTCPGRWRYLLLYTNTDNDGDGPMFDFGEVEVLVQACADGFYGENCDKQCLDRKCKAVSTSSCDRLTGACTEGCQSGWWQEDCTQECETGFYGSGCTLSCSARKCNDPSSQCDRRTGQCAGSCQAGYQGADCSQRCSSGITYGVNCEKNCTSRHCVTSPRTCDTETGQCPAGCEPGWTGVDCAGPTNNQDPVSTPKGTNNRNTMTSTPDTNNPNLVYAVVGAVVGSVFVTLLVVILLVVGLIRQGRLQWVNRTEERTPIQTSTDTPEISFSPTQPVVDPEEEQPSRHVYTNDYDVLNTEQMRGNMDYDVIQRQQYQNTIDC